MVALREILFPLPNARGFEEEKDFCRACDACSTVCGIVSILLSERVGGSDLLSGSRPHLFPARRHPELPPRGCGGPTPGQSSVRGEWKLIEAHLIEVEDEVQFANVLESPV